MNGSNTRHVMAVTGSQIAASTQSRGSKVRSVHTNRGITKCPVTKMVRYGGRSSDG